MSEKTKDSQRNKRSYPRLSEFPDVDERSLVIGRSRVGLEPGPGVTLYGNSSTLLGPLTYPASSNVGYNLSAVGNDFLPRVVTDEPKEARYPVGCTNFRAAPDTSGACLNFTVRKTDYDSYLSPNVIRNCLICLSYCKKQPKEEDDHINPRVKGLAESMKE